MASSAKAHLKKMSDNKLALILQLCHIRITNKMDDADMLTPVYHMIHEYLYINLVERTDRIRDDRCVVLIPFASPTLGDVDFNGMLRAEVSRVLPPCIAKIQSATPMIQFKYGDTQKTDFQNLRAVAKMATNPNTSTSGGTCACNTKEKYHGKGIKCVVTTDFKILDDEQLEERLEKGPNFRTGLADPPTQDEHGNGGWQGHFANQLLPYKQELVKKYGIAEKDATALTGNIATLFKQAVMKAIEEQEDSTIVIHPNECEKFWSIRANNPISPLIVTSMDKFQDRFALCCRTWYYKMCFEYLNDGTSFIPHPSESEVDIVKRVLKFTEEEDLVCWFTDKEGKEIDKPNSIPYLYASVKLHKPNKTGTRLISGGSSVATTPISKIVSVALRALYPSLDAMWFEMFIVYTGLRCPQTPILKTTDELTHFIENELNPLCARGMFKADSTSVTSSDFEKLYPSVEQQDLCDKVAKVINFGFDAKTRFFNTKRNTNGICKEAILVVKQFPLCKEKTETPTRWAENVELAEVKGTEIVLTAKKLINYMEYVVKNSFVTFGFGRKIYKLTTGIPTGTNMSPEVTNLYLLYYEWAFFLRELPKWNEISVGQKLFMFSYRRFIDDIFAIEYNDFNSNDILYFDEDDDSKQQGIYPKVLRTVTGRIIKDPLKLNTDKGIECNFLDCTIKVDSVNNRFTWTLFDKRRHMTVNDKPLSDMRNFPHVDTMLTMACKLGVITSQMFRFNRRCFTAKDFIKETVTYCRKLVREGYEKKKVLKQVLAYRHWVKSRGQWKEVIRILRKRILAI
jgi:hypothetical protein